MSKKESLWNYTSKAEKPWFHMRAGQADDKFTAIVVWLLGLSQLVLPIVAIVLGEWKWFWLAVFCSVFQWLLISSQDKDAPWMQNEHDKFKCPHCDGTFERKDMDAKNR